MHFVKFDVPISMVTMLSSVSYSSDTSAFPENTSTNTKKKCSALVQSLCNILFEQSYINSFCIIIKRKFHTSFSK